MAETETVFVSYQQEEDKSVLHFVQQLKHDLEDTGFSVSLNPENKESSSASSKSGRPSGPVSSETGIHKCTFFIPVITQKYAKSRYCMNELYAADGDQKTIFPVLYDDPEHVDFEGTELGRGLKFIISGINWTMFRPGRDDYGESLTKLVKGMKSKVNEGAVLQKSDAAERAATIGPPSATPIKVITGIQYPAQLVTGPNGEIVVASFMGHKIHVYNQDYELVRTIGSPGVGDGQLMCPSGVAIDKLNRVIVSSPTKLDVFSMEGKWLSSKGSAGNGPLQFTNASGLAIGKGGEIYVVDQMNHRVQVLNSDLSYVTSFSKASENLGAGCLNQPQSIAINSEGNLYVVDMRNNSIQVFDPKGEFLFNFGEFGPMNKLVPGNVRTPMAVAIDGQDNVYIGNIVGTVPIFDKDGTFLREFGTCSSKMGQFKTITGLHIDHNGHLYVSEGHSHRIEVFEGSLSMKKEIKATKT